jgi:hypothetical protein
MDDIEDLARWDNGMEALKLLLSKRETTEEGLMAFLSLFRKEDDANVDD